MQNRKSGIANVTGWIAAAGARRRPRIREIRRARGVRPRSPSRGGAGRARRPATRRARRTTICANASASGDGHTSQSGASSARNGSTCPPRRTICSPVALCGDLERVGRAPCSRPPAPCSRGRTAPRGSSCSSSGRWRRGRHSTPPSRPRRPASTPVRARTSKRRARPRDRTRSWTVELLTRASPDRRRPGSARGPSRVLDARTARATVTTATASVHDVWNGVGWPLPGVSTIPSGTNHTSPSRGCASATTTSSSAK